MQSSVSKRKGNKRRRKRKDEREGKGVGMTECGRYFPNNGVPKR